MPQVRPIATGKWEINDAPPNTADELARCQRYQLVFKIYDPVGYFQADGTPRGFIPTPVSMRSNPTTTNGNVRIVFGNAEKISTDSVVLTAQLFSKNIVSCNFTKSDTLPLGTFGYMDVYGSGATDFILDANL